MKEKEENLKKENTLQEEKKDKRENKAKKEKQPKEKKNKKEKKDKETSKFVQSIKKNWIINGTKTGVLIVLIIAVFVAITFGLHSLDLTPLDFKIGRAHV